MECTAKFFISSLLRNVLASRSYDSKVIYDHEILLIDSPFDRPGSINLQECLQRVVFLRFFENKEESIIEIWFMKERLSSISVPQKQKRRLSSISVP